MHSNNPKISTLKNPTGGIKKPAEKPPPMVGKFTGHAVRLGISYDLDKWRCSTCKFLNQADHKQCKMCREEHKVPVKQQQQQGRPPLRQPYNPVKSRGYGTGRGGGVPRGTASRGAAAAGRGIVRGGGGVRVGGPLPLSQNKPTGQIARPRAFSRPAAANPSRPSGVGANNPAGGRFSGGANIVTFKDFEQQHKSVMGEAKKTRFHKESNLQMLKKIAQNSQNGDTMPCMRKVKDKQFVQNLRDPAKFNMHTFVREYGDVPK